jgi:hypothetical protein
MALRGAPRARPRAGGHTCVRTQARSEGQSARCVSSGGEPPAWRREPGVQEQRAAKRAPSACRCVCQTRDRPRACPESTQGVVPKKDPAVVGDNWTETQQPRRSHTHPISLAQRGFGGRRPPDSAHRGRRGRSDTCESAQPHAMRHSRARCGASRHSARVRSAPTGPARTAPHDTPASTRCLAGSTRFGLQRSRLQAPARTAL